MEDTQFIGKINSTEITDEMKKAYLDYAMSVIVSRALPDIRDGLKPVQRRILYAMQRLGLAHTAQVKKTARIVGEVIGKFHPHGDAAVYESLVRLAQDFSLRYPLIIGQGNFGSVDGDPPAAMRYTEAKLSAISDELLSDLEKDTVDFGPNFDATEEEPNVLPANLPNLMLNGSEGIAVGMATRIPPHNLGEVIKATIYLADQIVAELARLTEKGEISPQEAILKQPALTARITCENLLEFIQGPDFPTGGEIFDWKEIQEAYKTGRGRILMRGRAEIVKSKDGRFQIQIRELPYLQNKALLMAQIANLVNIKKIQDVADLRDESDREGLRIVLDLKSSANPQKVQNQLYRFSSLQQVYHLNMVALVAGQPQVSNLKQLLWEYLKHRQIVIIRRTQFELNEAKKRAHILEGYRVALDNLDAVIELIKKSKDQKAALAGLMEKFNLSEIQAQAILDLQLKRLTALDRQKIIDELKETLLLIEKLTSLLASPVEILRVVKEELAALKEKYADARRTKLHKGKVGEISEEELIKEERILITLSRSGYIKRLPTDTYRRQGRGGKGVTGAALKEEDAVAQILSVSTHDQILFFTNLGRVFSKKAYEIPEASRTARGQAVVNLIGIEQNERVVTLLKI